MNDNLRRVNLAMIKNRLPKNAMYLIAKSTRLSPTTVRKYYKGIPVSTVSGQAIIESTVKIMEQNYKREDWTWRFERAISLMTKEARERNN